jgi:hypothetical protein
MQFLLYEVLARIVAIWCCVYCFRTLRSGLIERKVTSFPHHHDVLDWVVDSLVGWQKQVYHRDTAPIGYWMEMGVQALSLVACLGVTIFGWFHPNS